MFVNFQNLQIIDHFCKFLAFSHEFQKFFVITRTIFSQNRSEQLPFFSLSDYATQKKKKRNEKTKHLPMKT